jgi:CHAT domain-containing protein/tetratricopeptide (TPR) repeat protein
MTLMISLGCGCLLHPNPSSFYQKTQHELESGQLAVALADADRGIGYYRFLPQWPQRFAVLKAEIMLWKGDYQTALTLLNAIQLAPEDSHLLIHRMALQSLANCRLHNLALASEQSLQAEKLARSQAPELLGLAWLSRGSIQLTNGDLDAADATFQQMVQLTGGEEHALMRTAALGNLGTIARQRHFHDQELDIFSGLLQEAQAQHNPLVELKALGNLGLAYLNLGDFERAHFYYEKSIDIAKAQNALRDQLMGENGIGVMAEASESHVESLKHFQDAYVIAQKLGDHDAMAMCLGNLAMVAIEAGDYTAAQNYNRQAMELSHQIGNHDYIFHAAINQARILSAQGKSTEAVQLLRQTRQDVAGDAMRGWELEAVLAGVYQHAGQTRVAEASYARTMAASDKVRASIDRVDLRLSFMTRADWFYYDYADFLVSRGKAKEALLVADHERARTLEEGLNSAPRPARHYDPQQIAARNHTVILAYLLNNKRSYLWVVTPQQTKVIPLPGAGELEAMTRAYRKVLMGPTDPARNVNALGQQLYQTLVQPAAPYLRPGSNVTIVGSRSLNGLNFETLLAPGDKPHYWIEDATLNYAPSIAFLAEPQKQRQGMTNSSLLLMGDAIPANSEFPQLAQANNEVEKVEAHFAPGRRKVLLRSEATARNYLASNAGGYNYLHFVTHGTASTTDPLESSIVLSPDGGPYNYKLYARQIMTQPLHADLVTVSACYGAGVRAYAGEGLVGLSWAFLHAGARNVIASLWEVDDASTPMLMEHLYGYLQQGKTPTEALRRAKLDLLHSGTVYRRPYYWAAFQLYTGS